MPARHPTLAACALLLTFCTTGAAQAVCTSAQIIAQEPSCPSGSGPCSITGDYTIDNGCTMDFGARAVTLFGRFTLQKILVGGVLTPGAITIRAGRFTLAGVIDGVGDSMARGGLITLEIAGSFETFENSRIDLSGNTVGGDLLVRAGGPVSIAGRILATFVNQGAAGGLIDIISGNNVLVTGQGLLSAAGGRDSDGGGEIDLTAGGNIDVISELDVSGLCGGFIEIEAAGTVTLNGINASGGGDAGDGGCVDVVAGLGIQVLGRVVSNGAAGEFMTGGYGGMICLEAKFGDFVAGPAALISANGASPDGGAGCISITAAGKTQVRGRIESRGPDGDTCGGEICIDTRVDLEIAAHATATLDASGGDGGLGILLLAGRDVAVLGDVDARGRKPGGLGGEISVRAGQRGSGSLTLAGAVDVGSRASCNDEDGCGEAGLADVSGCNVTLTPTGRLDATAPVGGRILLLARELLTIQGTVDASRTTPTGTAGAVRIVHPSRRPPMVLGAVSPPAVVTAVATCPNQGPTVPPCLPPCPVCGDNIVQFPETCDLGILPPAACLGCSIFCQPEVCDDGLTCTMDLCNPAIGCINRLPPAPCTEPTPTITGTPPTATATPTVTSTPTATETRTHTPTHTTSATPSETPTPPPSPTLTASATGTPTRTATDTPPPSPTASPTATGTDTATPTVSPTPVDTATATPPPPTETAAPSCAGDCSGDGTVTVNELIVGVNIALGNTAPTACPAFDTNRDQMVSINELIAAVNALLNGC